MAKHKQHFTRRAFLDRTARGTVGLMGYPLLNSAFSRAGNSSLNKSKVVLVKHDQASFIEQDGRNKFYRVDQTVAQAMLNAGIKRLAGSDELDLGEAWKSFFPGITRDKKISIKVNCIGPGWVTNGLATHPEVAFGIANGLTCMQVDGQSFPAENITIWDRSDWELERAGFTINKSEQGVKCFGTRRFRTSGVKDGYDSTGYPINGSTQYLSKIFVEQTDYLINLCLLKDHSTSGATLSLKNHYGTIHQPDCNPIHNNSCNPAIPQINAIPMLREKQVLCICEAIYGINSGGPNAVPNITPNTILFSTDTVALDTVGTDFLVQQGMSTYKATKARRYLETAASDAYQLGTCQLDQIDSDWIENPATAISPELTRRSDADFHLYQNFPNPFNAQTTLSYRLNQPQKVIINIYNLQGEFITNLVDACQQPGYYRIAWNGTTSNGLSVSSGLYLAQFQIGKVTKTVRMQLIK